MVLVRHTIWHLHIWLDTGAMSFTVAQRKETSGVVQMGDGTCYPALCLVKLYRCRDFEAVHLFLLSGVY